jgi:hypothetical protein
MQFIKGKNARKLTEEQRVAASQKMLDETYPAALGVTFGILKILLITAVVTLQVLAFIYKSTFYYVGVGYDKKVCENIFFCFTLSIIFMQDSGLHRLFFQLRY